jgi:hypothetical protein
MNDVEWFEFHKVKTSWLVALNFDPSQKIAQDFLMLNGNTRD